MTRLRSVFVITSICLSILALVFNASGQVQYEYVEGQLIVKLKPAVQRAQVADVESALLSSVNRQFSSIGAELWDIQGMTVAEALQRFQYDQRFEYIEPNYVIRLDATFPNDLRFPEMWGLHNTGQTGGTPDADIDAPEAWDLETGDSVLVGIIDTGIDYTHQDLAAHIWINPGEIPNNGLDDDGNGFVDDVRGWDFANNDNDPMDGNGHGTHVSGTVGAIGNNNIGVVGVNWNAKLMAIKFLSDGGSGSTANAISAVEYATLMGARLTNNSWGGGGFSQALKDAIQTAGTAGMLFVAAAGNTGTNSDIVPHYPSSYNLDNIISVANTNHNDLLSSTSTFGAVTVDLGAPGSNILSSFPGNTYGTISGTSMASPHVAGAVSLLWSAAPTLGPLEIKNIIMSSVDPLPALAGKTVTGGRLNIFNALSGLDSIPPSPVGDLAVIGTGSNTATLQWTASGDDSTAGTATRYDIRYSLAPIDESNFDAATPAPSPPAPQPSGATETFQVQGLDFNTTYFFALRVIDEQENASPASNSPSGTTLGIPQIAFAPASLSDSLATGGASIHIVTIRNLGAGTLDFSFPGLDPLPASPGGPQAASAVAPTWLHAVPNSGRVLAGDSMDVEMRFNADGLPGGDLTENVVIASNDPLQPAVLLSVQLRVSAAPDIAASADSLNYGAHFIGAVVTRSVDVSNNGTALLNVSGVGVDNAEYSVDPAGFALAPSQTRSLVVTFAPTSAGPVAGTLTVSSDDPDTPALTVALTGEGLIPPEIAVLPDSLSESLVFGTTSTQTLTIENNGGSDLVFDISERAGALSGARVVSQGTSRDITPLDNGEQMNTGPAWDKGRAASKIPRETAPVKAEAAAAGGNLAILLLHAGDVTAIRNDLLAFPDIITVDTFDGRSGTPTLVQLQAYTAVIVIINTAFADPVGVGDVLADYADAGGGVVMTLASFIPNWDIRGRFANEGYFPFTLGSGPAPAANLGSFDATHPIMAGVTSAFGDFLGFTTLAPGAEWVADWDSGLPLVATQRGQIVGVNVFLAETPAYGGDVPLILHNAVQYSGGNSACWLTAEPTQGTVPAGSNAFISVTFEAISTACVTGGDFLDTLVVASNDPLAPEVLVPVSLHVTGAPDIAVSDSTLDYGTVFIGVTKLDTVVVSNQGTDLLTVSGVSVDNAEYSVDPAGFALSVGATHDLVVAFSPSSEGAFSGTLTISSDDPDTPSLGIALAGDGLAPPDIKVYPDSLTDSLFTGETSTQPLTIGNLGGSDLLWNLRTTSAPAAAMKSFTLTAPTYSTAGSDEGEAVNSPPNFRTTPITVLLEDLTGVKILWDRVHGQGSTVGWTTIIADLTARGAVVDINSVPITPLVLDGYDVLWTIDLNAAWTTSELAALTDWILAGGSLLLEGDNGATVTIYNTILSTLGAGIQYSPVSGASGITNFIFPHQTTENVLGISLSANIAHLSSVTAPAGLLVNDVANVPNSAYSEVGAGRIVAMADEVFSNSRMGTADNQLFANQVFDWLAGGVRWLNVEPTSGVNPADSLDVLTATYDAAGLIGGSYDASIMIFSNDPFVPEVTVAAHLHVTGAPDIAVSDSALDYGTVFIGGSGSDTVRVSNVGTDVLTVGVSSSHADYSPSVPAMSLAVGATFDLAVTFAPTSEGPIPAVLTLTSDDPDEPVVEVTLQGSGLLPPIVSVVPDSLSDSLLTGLTSDHTISIGNSGASDLEFTIRSEVRDSSLAAVLEELAALEQPGANGLTEDAADHKTRYEEYAAGGYKADPSQSVLPQTSPEILGLYNRAQSVLAGGVTLFFDDMESGTAGWTHYATHPNAIDQWAPSTVRASSGVTSWRVSQHSFEGSDALETPPISLTLVSNAFLSFQHWYNFDDCGGDPLFEPDGGIVEITADGGSTWTQIFPVDGYPYVLDDICFNPLALLPAYSHDGGVGAAFVPAVYDLTAYAGNVVSLRFHAGWDCGNCESNEGWYIDDVSVYTEGVGWISSNPAAGTVAPGGSTDVTVTFDATGLFGGDHDAFVVVDSNDPLAPETRVAAHLHVTGAPDIAVSDSALDYGSWFLGSVVPDTILISNIGTDTLVVSGLVLSNTEFTAQTAGFVLQPTESRELVVSFAPTILGPQAGTLTINSNDPDDPVLAVALSGTGLPAPDAAVYPDSVFAGLFTGGSATRPLTIGNIGDNVLEWNLRVELTTIAQLYTLTAPAYSTAGLDAGEEGDPPQGFRTTPITALLEDLTGVKILWDQAHGQGSTAGWTTIIADLTARGAVVDVNSVPITPLVLDGYDVLWTIDLNAAWTPSELTALTDWIQAGGSLLLEGDNGPTVTIYNTILSALGAGIQYSPASGASGITNFIFPHQTTENVLSISLNANIAHLSSVAAPAGLLVNDVVNVPNSAYSEVGAGRIVAMADEVFSNSRMGTADNQLFANQVFDWLAAGVPWLNVSPTAGVTPVDSLDVLTVGFDAAGLNGGPYDARIIFETNDPLDPVIEVSAHLDVTGAPDIALSDTLLDYGAVFIGGVATDTITVSNEGTDLLTVGFPPPANPDYTVSVPTLSLNPGERADVVVSFAPSTTGPRVGTLTAASNDPDEPVLTIALQGSGLIAPIISVAPDSLADSLFTGETSMHTVTIDNTGGSDLTFEIVIQQTGSPLAVSAVLRPGNRGDGGPGIGLPRAVPPAIEAGSQVLQEWETAGPPQPLDGGATTPIDSAAAILFQDDFEDGDFNGWIDAGPGTNEVTDATAAAATVYSYHEFNSRLGHFDGVYQQFTPMQPAYIGFYIRSSSAVANDAYFVLRDSGGRETIWFFAQATGMLYVNGDVGGHQTYPYAANTWYHIEFKNIDFLTKTFDYYVDGVLVLAGIPFRNATSVNDVTRVDLYSFDGFAESWWDQIWFSTGEEPSTWVGVAPLAGTVPAGSSLNLDVTFNAAGLIGGGYDANISIGNNDPLNPVVNVPVHLHVTGAPDIAVSDSLLDYGLLFVGATAADTITVSNTGTDSLHVSSVSSDDPAYTADVSNFALGAGGSREVVVTFSPTTVGVFPAVLSIDSDDPDTPTLSVDLQGAGVLPPVIAVSPDSLVDSLFTGDVSTKVLTIDNSGGGSSLEFTIALRLVASGAAAASFGIDGGTGNRGSLGFGDEFGKRALGFGGGPGGVAAAFPEADGRLITIRPPRNLGLNFFDPSKFETQRRVPAAQAAAPRIVTVDLGKPENYLVLDILGIPYTLVAPAALAAVNLRTFDLLYVGWTPGASAAGMQALVDKKADIAAFIAAGGGIVALSETGGSPQDWQWLPFPIGFLSTNRDVVTVVNAGHPVMAGLTGADLSNWSNSIHNTFTSFPTELEVLATESTSGQAAIIGGQMGGGRVVLCGLDPDWHLVNRSGPPGAGILLQNALNWAGEGPGFIFADPLAGSVPAGATMSINITFDATGLLGGDYNAELVVASNDPVTPEVIVPAHLNVTGAPNISVPDSLVTFPPLFIGGSVTRNITVSNVGTDLLAVTNVAADNGDYTATPVSFSLNPGQSQVVAITFAPSVAGPIPATLTITSNDPDQGMLDIALQGEGLVPPQIAARPDSLHEALFAGEMSQQTLTITNPGGSNLVFSSLITVSVDSSAAASAAPGAIEPDRGLPRLGDGPQGVSGRAGQALSVAPVVAKERVDGGAAGGAAVAWLTLTPPSGTIAPDDSLQITVTFDATALLGGLFSATINLNTNVPTQPVLGVPATLVVTGVPKIAVSDTLLDFGSVFLGFPASKTLKVRNVGTDVLSVSDIVSNQPEYAVVPTAFDVPIGGEQVVNVTFTPTAVGPVPAIMTITSNDTSQVDLDVGLEAVGLVAPTIVMSVDSLVHSIQPGDTRLDTITVSNTGGSDLLWNLDVVLPAGAGGAGGPLAAARSDVPLRGETPTGVFNVMWHGDHGLGGIALWSIIISDITARGASVVQNTAPITPSLLAGVDILWLGNTTTPLGPGEVTAIADWVLAGGGLLIEADNVDGTIGIYNALQAAIGSGIFYIFASGFGGITDRIQPHEMTSGVNQLFLIGPETQIGLVAPANDLFDDLFGQVIGAYSEVGSGRVVAITDQPFHDVAINLADNRLFANQVFNWLAELSWLTVAPVAGTVAPGSSAEIALTIDATILPPGVYQQNLRISSNDPATPVVTIPVHLTVDSTAVVTGFDTDLPGIPEKFGLHQNYPNPLNPTTTIVYDLPRAVDTRLVVFNVRGERVRDLVNEHQQPGRYRVQWDGRNARGEPVASGVYFYRLTAGDFARTRKMIMLK